MRAAVLHEVGAAPVVEDFRSPPAGNGHELAEVVLAGLNPVDLTIAAGRMGTPEVPCVVGREGIARLGDGSRVYFGSSIAPFGSFAERTLIDRQAAFPVPDGLADDLAVSIGIAGLAAWLSLEHQAKVRPGEHVLVLGASGVVGQIAVQAARALGAGRVVGAARDSDALQRVAELGADATVTLSGDADRDPEALRAEAGTEAGYEVVIDPLYGPPFLAALAASAPGARLVTLGLSAAPSADVPFRALQGRTHIGHGNQLFDRDAQRAAYEQLATHALAGRIEVKSECFALADAPAAWEKQAHGPHHKLVVVP